MRTASQQDIWIQADNGVAAAGGTDYKQKDGAEDNG